MGISQVCKSVIKEILEDTLPNHYSVGEIDTKSWFACAHERFAAKHPELRAAFQVEAEYEMFRVIGDEYVRTSKHPLMLRANETGEINRNVRNQRRIIRLRNADGSYTAKRAVDMTTTDVAQYLQQIDNHISGWKRIRAFWSGVHQQLSILGESATVADVVDEDDIGEFVA